MSYRLHVDHAHRKVIADLPVPVGSAVYSALLAACDDPMGATQADGEDDGIVRVMVLEHTIITVLLGHQTGTITVLQITHLG